MGLEVYIGRARRLPSDEATHGLRVANSAIPDHFLRALREIAESLQSVGFEVRELGLRRRRADDE